MFLMHAERVALNGSMWITLWSQQGLKGNQSSGKQKFTFENVSNLLCPLEAAQKIHKTYSHSKVFF